MLLLHILTGFAHQVLGTGYFSTRLPELLGFLIMMLGIYVFLRRRLPLPYAILGMVFPISTLAWQYAFEARAYGILLGCAGVTLAAWQNAAEGRYRKLSLIAIALSTLVAMGSHPFGGLLLVPFGLGELVRTIELRKIDWAVWAALCAGLPVVAAYPLLFAAVHGLDMHGVHPTFSEIPSFYSEVFHGAITPVLVGGGLALFYASLIRGTPPEKDGPAAAMPRYELAALAGLVVAPLIVIGVYMTGAGGMFWPRYGLICVVGAACLVALLAFRATAGNLRLATALLIGVVAWLGLARGKAAAGERQDPRERYLKSNPLLQKALTDGRPVVVNEPVIFLESDFYFPSESLSRLYYVVLEPEIRKRYPWQDVSDQLLVFTAQHIRLRAHLEDWRNFMQRNPVFILHTDGQKEAMQQTLLKNGWQMSLTEYSSAEALYEVKAPTIAYQDPKHAEVAVSSRP
jgi:hypothetical protein